jgi:GNAT superfamily N-acetyltransferase
MAGFGSDSAITIRPLTGDEIAPALDALAALRIDVFRAYPYLYDGSAAYERAYLAEFAERAGAVLVAAFDGKTIVGAATGAPLSTQKPEFRAPFEAAGLDPDDIFYFGESVLLPAWRDRGVGHSFFDHREARARAEGARLAAFCAVMRPPDHPARPAGYAPLDAFWRKRGYAPADGMVTSFSWRDIGDEAETAHPMQVWMRRLD